MRWIRLLPGDTLPTIIGIWRWFPTDLDSDEGMIIEIFGKNRGLRNPDFLYFFRKMVQIGRKPSSDAIDGM